MGPPIPAQPIVLRQRIKGVNIDGITVVICKARTAGNIFVLVMHFLGRQYVLGEKAQREGHTDLVLIPISTTSQLCILGFLSCEVGPLHRVTVKMK